MSEIQFSSRWVLVGLLSVLPPRSSASAESSASPGSAGRCFFTAIAAGSEHSLALSSDGAVAAWGRNFEGQLGCGKNYPRTPVLARDISDVKDIAAGAYHSLGITADGKGWAWGRGDGQLGNGKTGDFYYPDAMVNIGDMVAVDGGGVHSVALDVMGSVWAFGLNSFGQLGDNSTAPSIVPVAVWSLSGVATVASGQNHSLAVRASDSTVWAWGWNLDGELGDGTFQDRQVPVQAAGLSSVVAVTGGFRHSLALDQNGQVWAWGDNDYGQLGNGTTLGQNVPILVPGLTAIMAIATGAWHSLALKDDGTVLSWGANSWGQLGLGFRSTRSTAPLPVASLAGVVAMASSFTHSLAVKDDGTVWAWGNNPSGNLLGDGTTSASNVPLQVQFDAVPKDQGNVLRALREGANVALTFEAGTAPSWRLFADGRKDQRGTTMVADVATPSYLDVDAISRGDIYYYLRGLSMCTASPGP